MSNQFWDSEPCGGCERLEKENTRLRQQVDDLVSALEPFALAADRWSLTNPKNDRPLSGGAILARGVRVEHWRRASEIVGKTR